VELDGAVVAITGASRGIGEAVARRSPLGERRWASSPAHPTTSRTSCAGWAGTASRFPPDAADRAAIVDALVANAGIGAYGPLVDMTYEEMERVVGVNVLGTMYAVRAVLPGMVARRRATS